MYTDFFGLAKKPFNMTPDPEFLFVTLQHREALAGLSYAILERRGFLVLSGTAGSGKTTLLAWLLGKLPAGRIKASVILNPTLTRDEFLEMSLLNFGVKDIPVSKAKRLELLQKLLLQGKQEGIVHALIIDEAHKLNAELLEEVRLLGNFETPTEKLLQILLVGQAELDDRLSQPDLWQLKQRIAVRLTLRPLGEHEIEEYIRHRWRIAGGTAAPPFTREAIAAITSLSQGIPRLVNSICDNALVLAFADEAQEVGAKYVETAGSDLALRRKPRAQPAAAAVTPGPRRVSPVEAPVLKSVEGYSPKKKKSLVSRWAVKLGLA